MKIADNNLAPMVHFMTLHYAYMYMFTGRELHLADWRFTSTSPKLKSANVHSSCALCLHVHAVWSDGWLHCPSAGHALPCHSPLALSPQTGSETSVERLMKQISSFMSEISDEFKTVVVEAIQSVCVKFPRKHHIIMNFLSSMLREEGGFEYKKAIVKTIIIIIEENPEVKETGGSWDRHTGGPGGGGGSTRSSGLVHTGQYSGAVMRLRVEGVVGLSK